MKNMMNKVSNKVNELIVRTRCALVNCRAEGFVVSGVKILIAVVIGALLLGGLYLLFNDTILPTLTNKIKELFNYAG